MKTIKLLFATLVIVATACSVNDEPEIANYTNAQTFFENLDFTGSVIITKNGSDVIRQRFGYANTSTGETNELTTKFRLGSASKTLTGMGIIQLKRDGLIESFDQPLSDFDEDFPNGNQITIKHLLFHQSGVPDYQPTFEALAKQGEVYPPTEIYEAIKETIAEDGLHFNPGSSTEYSNSNFLIAALLIEELSNTTYEEYLTEHVLIPLEMNDTEIGSDQIPEVGYAQGYDGNSNVSEYPMEIAFGCGQWTSTAEDMEKWCSAAMSDSWFSTEEKEIIFGGDVPEGNTLFGMAWFKTAIDGKKFYWHGGDIDGFWSLIGFIPSSKSIIICLSNEQDNTAQKRNSIIETIIKEELSYTH